MILISSAHILLPLPLRWSDTNSENYVIPNKYGDIPHVKQSSRLRRANRIFRGYRR